jgi:hypothetical protein
MVDNENMELVLQVVSALVPTVTIVNGEIRADWPLHVSWLALGFDDIHNN